MRAELGSGRLRLCSGGGPGRQPFRQIATRDQRRRAGRRDACLAQQRFEFAPVVAGEDVDRAADM